MPRIVVTKTITDYVNLDIPDFAYTRAEIDKKLEEAIDDLGFEIDGEIDWEWSGSEPKPKEELSPPSPEFWFDSKFGKLATNGCLLITEKFPIPAEFSGCPYEWRQPNQESLKLYEGLLGKSIEVMVPHSGWFAEMFKSFLKVPGLTVLSESKNPESTGYLVLSDEIVGVMMPVQKLTNKEISCFQWKQEAA
jgi:hypothetical protein